MEDPLRSVFYASGHMVCVCVVVKRILGMYSDDIRKDGAKLCGRQLNVFIDCDEISREQAES